MIQVQKTKDKVILSLTTELDYEDVELYSPDIIVEEDLLEIEEDYIIEIIYEYLKSNDLPDEIVL